MKNTKYTNTAIGIVVVSGLLIGVYFYFSNKGAVEVENPIDIFHGAIPYNTNRPAIARTRTAYEKLAIPNPCQANATDTL